jgi:hypothetical protein
MPRGFVLKRLSPRYSVESVIHANTGPAPPEAPSQDSNPWRLVPGPGQSLAQIPLAQISVGSKDSVWALDSEGRAYQYSATTNSWSWLPACPLGLRLASIVALASGRAWGLNMNTGEIWGYGYEP